MKIELEPTGTFETVSQASGRVQCRIWRGTYNGARVIAYIPCVGLHKDASPEEQAQWEKELRLVKADRELVSFDMRMVLD